MAESTTRIVVFDTTLRDGEQAPGFSLDVESKIQLARALDGLGVDVIEAGFPSSSAGDADAVHRIAEELRRPIVAALARCRRSDIDEAARAIAPAERGRLHLFLATSDLHLEQKLRISRETCVEAVARSVVLARQYTDDVEFSAEDATRTDREFLCRVVEAAIAAGARTINLPDTVGYALPDETRLFFSEIIERVPNAHQAMFSAHCHDDLGLAVANSVSAIIGGARQVECTLNGVGERAGNAALEELVMAMRVRRDRLPYDTHVSATGLFAASRLLSRLTGEPVQANKAIVGRNAFAHEAGIHQDGVLKDPRTYQIICPEDVGQPARQLVLGRHSGRHTVRRRCAELGFLLADAELETVYRAVIAAATRQRSVDDAMLRRIVAGTHPAEEPTAGRSLEVIGYGHGV